MTQDDVLALTSHELAYLINAKPGAGADLAIEILGVPTVSDPASFSFAGASSLYVRGFATATDDNLRLAEEVAVFGMLLTDANSAWVELALMSESEAEAAYLVFNEDAGILLSPRALATFELRPLRVENTAGNLSAKIAFAFLETHVPSVAYLRLRSGSADVALAVRILADGGLQLSEEEGKNLYSGNISSDRGTILTKIADLLDGGVSVGADRG